MISLPGYDLFSFLLANAFSDEDFSMTSFQCPKEPLGNVIYDMYSLPFFRQRIHITGLKSSILHLKSRILIRVISFFFLNLPLIRGPYLNKCHHYLPSCFTQKPTSHLRIFIFYQYSHAFSNKFQQFNFSNVSRRLCIFPTPNLLIVSNSWSLSSFLHPPTIHQNNFFFSLKQVRKLSGFSNKHGNVLLFSTLI